MSALAGIQLGAPGIYRARPRTERALVGQRLDVCAFAGVAPRGPARVPVVDEKFGRDDLRLGPERPRRRSVAVPVSSFDEYRALYGGFEGPGLLPYAVASFFEQGGRLAYVIRIVPDDGRGPFVGHAAAALTGLRISGASPGVEVLLRARSEGLHGNGLRARLGYRTRPLVFERELPAHRGVEVEAASAPPVGTLLRARLADGTHTLRFVDQRSELPLSSQPGRIARLVFDQSLSDALHALEIVEGTLRIDSDDRVEEHAELGFDRDHPRWVARVLITDSLLVWPDAAWSERRLWPLDGTLPGDFVTAGFDDGVDSYAAIQPEDFFDRREPGSGDSGDGLSSAFGAEGPEEVALVCAPDLYHPAPLPAEDLPPQVRSLAGASFAPCVDLPVPGSRTRALRPELEGLCLDPGDPADLARIVALQRRIVELAERAHFFTALLDVPPGLDRTATLRWRQAFDCAFAAAYTPWLEVARPDDARDALIRMPPSALAAGIIASSELRFGVVHGPANELARNVLDVSEPIAERDHDQLHPAGINVFVVERDGVRLSAARTLARDPSYRQLSVRRFMTFLARTLERELQWAVFEPNGALLRRQLNRAIRALLRRFYLAGDLRGATEDEAFFVRADADLNPQSAIDAGRLVAEIGVAPAEPLEFLVVRLARDGDGTLTIEE